MGATTRWALPYPEPPDPADVPADMSALAAAVDAGLSSPTAELNLPAPQSVATGAIVKANLGHAAPTNILGDALAVDPANGRISILRAGWYWATAGAWFDANAAGTRLVILFMNGTGAGEHNRTYIPANLANQWMRCSALLQIPAGNSFETRVYQDSGGPLNLTGAAINVSLLTLV
jgi:hypothetical protein